MVTSAWLLQPNCDFVRSYLNFLPLCITYLLPLKVYSNKTIDTISQVFFKILYSFVFSPPGESCHSNGELRLAGGPAPNEGWVEICLQGIWGTICHLSGDSEETAIICAQLGFQSESKTLLESHSSIVITKSCSSNIFILDSSAMSISTYRDENRPIQLSLLSCRKQRNVLECWKRHKEFGQHSCFVWRDTALPVKCYSELIV